MCKFHLNMSKHVGEKCGKLADGDSNGESDERTDGGHGWTDITIHKTSRPKTGV